MKKTNKKILLITDDFGERHYDNVKHLANEGNYYYHEEDNWLSFSFDLSGDFSKIPDKEYDAVLIDYGLIGDSIYPTGNCDKAIKIITDFYKKGIPLAWCGGLVGRYNKDAKILFPDLKFLHNLPETDIGHDSIMFCLYKIFEKDKKMEIKEAVKILKEKGIKIRKLISSGYRLHRLYDKTDEEIIQQAERILAEKEKK